MTAVGSSASARPRDANRFDLVSGPVAGRLLALALPTLGASLLQSVQGTVNGLWIGRLLGEAAFSASYNVNLIIYFMSSAIFGFGVAATVLAGQALGRGSLDEARRALGGVIGLFVLLGAASAILVAALTPELLRVLGTPAAAQALASRYLQARLLATPAAFLILLMMMGMRGAGNAVMPLVISIWLVAGDAMLNPVFICGFGPVPAFGIAGSGLATVVSTYTGLAALVILIYATDAPLRLRGRELGYLFPRPALVRYFLFKGLPICLQTTAVAATWVVIANLVNARGAVISAAFAVAAQVWTYVQMPGTAVGAAVSAIAAQNIGVGRWDRVEEIVRIGLIASFIITGALAALAMIFGHAEAEVFLGQNSPGIAAAAHIINVTTWGLVLASASAVFAGALRANGAVVVPLLFNLLSLYPLRIGLAFADQTPLGVEALWWSFPISFAAMLAMIGAYYPTSRWRRTRLNPA